MADDKLNTNPQENTPPDVAALLGADTPPEHEQAVISGMGEEAPAPAGNLLHFVVVKYSNPIHESGLIDCANLLH